MTGMSVIPSTPPPVIPSAPYCHSERPPLSFRTPPLSFRTAPTVIPNRSEESKALPQWPVHYYDEP